MSEGTGRPPSLQLDFEHVFSSISSPMALLKVATDFELVAVNDAYCEITGRSRESMIGLTLFEAFPPEASFGAESAMRVSFATALDTSAAHVMPLQRYDIEDDSGFRERYWSVTNTPLTDPKSGERFILNHPEDVTSFVELRSAHDTGGKLEPAGKTRALNTVFTATIERLQHVNDLAASLIGATSVDEVSRALLRDGLRLAAATAGSVISDDGVGFDMLAAEGIDEHTTTAWRTFPFTPGAEPFSDSMESGDPLFFSTREEFLLSYPGLRDHLADEHFAWAVLPFRDSKRTIGALGLVYSEPTEFNHAQRLLLYMVASLGSQAMARARLVSEQTTAIDSFDRALLDMVIDGHDDLSVTGLYRASSSSITAGGDWYDVVKLPDARTLIAIGDIASHGPVAVGEMAHARSIVRATALGGARSDEIAAKTSSAIRHFGDAHATAFIAVYDHQTRRLTWTSAGHPPAMLSPADPGSSIQSLEAPHGPPLGIGSEYGFSERLVEPGDQLFIYTDGLIEERGVDLDVSFQHLSEFLAGHRYRLSVDDLFAEFHPDQRHGDDVAIVAVTFQL